VEANAIAKSTIPKVKRIRYTLPLFRSFHKTTIEAAIKTKTKMIEIGRGISSNAMNSHFTENAI
jgi:pyridoxine 5'-phosphate synthase PdxJ